MHSKIKSCLEILDYSIKNRVTVTISSPIFGKSERYVTSIKSHLDEDLDKEIISENEYDLFCDKYEQYLEMLRQDPSVKNKKTTSEQKTNAKTEEHSAHYDATNDAEFDERCIGEAIRDEDGKILKYYYNVKVSNEPDLVGHLTREEMERVYELYSKEGADLNRRSVSREFPNILFKDFKRILRAFEVTKDSIPIAPHVLEESTEEEAVELTFQNRERNYLKNLEQQRNKHFEKSYFDAIKELNILKKNSNNLKDMVSDIISNSNIEVFAVHPVKEGNQKALLVYISDQHVGAYTDVDSIYENPYDEAEFLSRLNKVLGGIAHQHEIHGRFDKIIICNLGDCMDGYDANTTRGGHELPQNMNNKEQFKVYFNGMLTFFKTLHELDLTNNLEYQCVTNDNHIGDFGYAANFSLGKTLEHAFPFMNVNIFEKFIQHFDYGVNTFILSHGKDKKDKKHGFPLHLDNKTELYFSEYIDRHRIKSDQVHVVSGDLHQSAESFGKRFRYKKVASMYGSSDWIHNNFGYTRPGVDFDVVSKYGYTPRMSGLIDLS